MRERLIFVVINCEIQRKSCKFPPGLQAGRLAKPGKGKIEPKHNPERREDSECSPSIKVAKREFLTGSQRQQDLRANQEAAQYKEQVDAHPTESRQPGKVLI